MTVATLALAPAAVLEVRSHCKTTMLHEATAAVVLVLFTLCLQCAGAAVLITWLRSVISGDIHTLRTSSSAVLVMQTTVAVIILQGLIILVWASCYRWLCFSSWESAFYFSASSYTTVGYGDVVLPAKWRLLGPLESMVGVLMCGISVSLLFVLVGRLVKTEDRGLLNQSQCDTASHERSIEKATALRKVDGERWAGGSAVKLS
jgi:hypothetical protein